MKYCIIGLGTFGTHLARQLNRDGHEIIAVDNNPAHIHSLKDEIEFIIEADCTDLNSFHEIPIDDCDAVIVAIGENFEASLSIASNVQQLGAKHIICRIVNPLHGRLLKLLKIDELIIPEAMAAAWLARSLHAPARLNSLDLGNGYEIAHVLVPRSMVGSSLQHSTLRSHYNLNLVTIGKTRDAATLSSTRHPITKILGNPNPSRLFEPDDVLVLFGLEKDILRLIHDSNQPS